MDCDDEAVIIVQGSLLFWLIYTSFVSSFLPHIAVKLGLEITKADALLSPVTIKEDGKMGDHETTQATNKRFVILDGLRGVAAVAVVIFHFMEWIFPDFSKNLIGHGFLAVDFFFCLSGFVIAYAYDNRISRMGFVQFAKIRLIRLHPLVVFGSMLGLAAIFIDPFAAEADTYGVGHLLLLFLASIFLIPAPAMEGRGFNLFGLNAPSWSLFWEYIANIIYATLLSRLNRIILTALLIIAAAILSVVALRAGNLLGGWAGDNFWDGGARVFYSFVAGMLIFRFNLIIRNKLGFVVPAIMLIAVFIMPSNPWNWLTELLVVLFWFPFLVALGAGSGVSAGMSTFCEFSGNISYPLYMTHYWAIWIFGHYYTSASPSEMELTIVVFSGTVLLILFAYVVMRFFDIPIRSYLTKKSKNPSR